MALSGVNHITLAVTDLDRSLAFYEGILGGTRAARWGTGAYLELGALWLCLEVAPRVAPGADDSHIALGCAADAFDALAKRIRANAWIWKDNSSEGPSVYFLDPDGHKLELHQGDLASRLAHYRAHPELGVTISDA